MSSIAYIREILNNEPSESTWKSLVWALEEWREPDTLELATQYCMEHLDSWPKKLPTFASNSWFKRSSKANKNDPRTALFVHAFQERTDVFRRWAERKLSSFKPKRPPKFMDFEALGKMRWRTGEVFDEEQRKQLIVFLKDTVKSKDAYLVERMRQLLNDDDCRRWSKNIYADWVNAGEKSGHNWSRALLPYFGSLESALRTGRNEMMVFLDCAESHEYLADTVFSESLTRVGAYRAYDALDALFSERGVDVHERINRYSSVYQELEKQENAILKQAEKGSLRDSDLARLAEVMEQSMTLKRHLSHEGRFEAMMSEQPIREALASTIWCADGKRFFLCVPESGDYVDLDDEAIELEFGAVITVAHPAAMKKKDRKAWEKRIKALGYTPLFAQLERKVFSRRHNMFSQQVEVLAELDFFYEEGWTIDNVDTGCEYTDVTVFFDPLRNLRIGVHLGYDLELSGGFVRIVNERALLGMYVRSLFSEDGADKDPIRYSEACLIVERLIKAAGVPEDE